MKSKNPNIGIIYAMIHKGSIVMKRKSTTIKVPTKFWDPTQNRVKSTYPDAVNINKMLNKKMQEFDLVESCIPVDDENQCVFSYIYKRMGEKPLTLASKKKYKTIFKNFESVVYKKLKIDTLQFSKLRDNSFIRLLKDEIRKSGKKNGFEKSNNTLLNYMRVFAGFIDDWNGNSGTPYPINVRPFTTEIAKHRPSHATILTHSEIQKLIEYEPVQKRSVYPHNLAKNIFLFQYHTGGIRIQDALTITNKDILSDGIEIEIRKTKEVGKFPFCFEQVETLKNYYPIEFNKVISTIRLGQLELTPSTHIQLNRIGEIDNLPDMGYPQFIEIHNQLKRTYQYTSELLEAFQTIDDEFRSVMAVEFFHLLRKRPHDFLFPMLKWEDFKGTYRTNGKSEFTQEHEDILHRARASHNSNLYRISKILSVPDMTGHTPRHTLVRHLQDEGVPTEIIQKILVHSSIITTTIYLAKRHQSAEVKRALVSSNSVFKAMRRKYSKV